MTICHPSRDKLIILDYMSCIYHACTGMKIGPPNKLCYLWLKNDDDKRRKGSERGSLSKGSWEHQRWSSYTQICLNKSWASNGKVNVCTVFCGITACPRPMEAAPLLFSHEQRQQCLQSSTNDNFCSWSVAMLIVHCLHIFQWHQITASLLCMVHEPSLKLPPLWAQFQFNMIRHWTSTWQSSLCRDLFGDLLVGNARGNVVFSYATKLCLINFRTETLE
jgi:hypothetical protein